MKSANQTALEILDELLALPIDELKRVIEENRSKEWEELATFIWDDGQIQVPARPEGENK